MLLLSKWNLFFAGEPASAFTFRCRVGQLPGLEEPFHQLPSSMSKAIPSLKLLDPSHKLLVKATFHFANPNNANP